MRFWKRFRNKPNGQMILMAIAVLLLVGLALPWPLKFDTYFEGSFFGIPTGYFFTTLAFPVAMLVVAFWFTQLASDIEPYQSDKQNDR